MNFSHPVSKKSQGFTWSEALTSLKNTLMVCSDRKYLSAEPMQPAGTKNTPTIGRRRLREPKIPLALVPAICCRKNSP